MNNDDKDLSKARMKLGKFVPCPFKTIPFTHVSESYLYKKRGVKSIFCFTKQAKEQKINTIIIFYTTRQTQHTINDFLVRPDVVWQEKMGITGVSDSYECALHE